LLVAVKFSKMEIFIGLMIGIVIGYCFLPKAKQKTIVKITETNVSFESNRKQDGDIFEVYKNDNLVLSGVVKNNEWV
jgi:hypothetical protein